MRTPDLPVTRADVARAHLGIAAHVRRTPLLAADRDLAPGAEVTLKLELLQHAGSFKTRGAFWNMLSRAVPDAGVTAASGGNHGVAVAFAAARLGHEATVFVPEIASPVKIAAIRAYGAEVVIGGARYADAQEACDAHAKRSGALLVHPFDAVETLAAQGTVALEWEEDQTRLGAAPIDTVLVAVGGGGLVAGMACHWVDRVKIVGVEPEGSRCLHAALEHGSPVDVPVESIAADSLGARRAGALPFEIATRALSHVALVNDASIRDAQRLLWSRYRLAAEPGGAAALAALLAGRYVPAPNERVGVLVCGSNVDPATLA
jgi:threonine dehydratase